MAECAHCHIKFVANRYIVRKPAFTPAPKPAPEPEVVPEVIHLIPALPQPAPEPVRIRDESLEQEADLFFRMVNVLAGREARRIWRQQALIPALAGGVGAWFFFTKGWTSSGIFTLIMAGMSLICNWKRLHTMGPVSPRVSDQWALSSVAVLVAAVVSLFVPGDREREWAEKVVQAHYKTLDHEFGVNRTPKEVARTVAPLGASSRDAIVRLAHDIDDAKQVGHYAEYKRQTVTLWR